MRLESGPYEILGQEVGALVDKKNQAYGSAFDKVGDILRSLYPDGIALGQYDDMLAIVRILDKLFRLATRKDAFGESPGMDIAGYGLLIAKRHDQAIEENHQAPAG